MPLKVYLFFYQLRNMFVFLHKCDMNYAVWE